MTLGNRGRIVAAVVVPIALLLSLLTWAVSSPPGSGPDDDYHMASIWCDGGTADGLCEPGRSDRYRQLPAELIDAARCFALQPDQAASCELHFGEMRSTDRGNWYHSSYPPVFYAAMHPFVGPDFTASVLMMRAVNVALYVGILTALFFLLPRPQRPVLVWTAAISIVPLGMFLIASLNPSAWAVLSGIGLWIATWGYFLQRGTRKWLLAALVVLLLVMGAGARSDAAVFGVFGMLVGMVLAFRSGRRFWLHALLPAVLTIIAVAFFFSSGQSAIISADTVVEDEPVSLVGLAFVNAKLLPQLWAGVFGLWGLGWLDTMLPGIVWVTTLGLFVALTFWGLRRGGARKWIALGASAASVIAVPMYILLHDQMVVGANVQPRYIYPLIIIFGGVALVGFTRANLGLGRLQLIVISAGLTLANSVALHVNLRRYITGQDVDGFNLNKGIEWWWGGPVSPMMVWAAGTVLFAVAAAALVWVAWERRPSPADTDEVDQPSLPVGA